MSKRGIEEHQIRGLARLARLELDGAEIERLTTELDSILAYLNQLEALDLEGVPPTCHVAVPHLPVRPDEPQRSLQRDVVLDQAPARAADAFVVPTFIDEEGSP